MRHREVIEELTDEILAEEIDYLALKNKLDDFNALLLEISGIQLEEESNKEDLRFENGVALSPSFAALCVVDIMRTRQFIRGIFAAVKQCQQKTPEPVKIFYAGTGPFATLVLPLLAKYRPEDLQLTLLEVNEKTVGYLKQVIKQLEIEDYIEKIICADATKYKIAKNHTVDILISETMQHGLVKEQQVPLAMNLVSQLNEDVIMIPDMIQLDLALMNSSSNLILENQSHKKYKVLKTLLEFDKKFIQLNAKAVNKAEQNKRFELCKQVHFWDDGEGGYDKLVVLTKIHVYGNEWIEVDASGLTIPKVLFRLSEVKEQTKISVDYVISNSPDFEYELS